MEDLLNNDLVISLAAFLAGLLASAIVLGARVLIKSFERSSNKIDDQLIPLLEKIADALDSKDTK